MKRTLAAMLALMLAFSHSVGAGELVLSGTGAATPWDGIGDPSGAGTVAFGATQQDITSTLDDATAGVEAALGLLNSDADLSNDTSVLDIAMNDGADANGFYLRMIGDADGTPTLDYLFSQTGATFLLDLAVPAEAYNATNWNGDTSVPQKDAIRDQLEAMPQTAGRSVTLNGTTLDADAELYTDVKTANIDPASAVTSWFVWKAPHAVTITGLDCLVDAATSVVLTARECDADGANCTDIEAAMTCGTTNTTEASGIDNNSIDAGDTIRITRGTVTGTPTQAVMFIEFTRND